MGTVKDYLEIYTTRKRMYEESVINFNEQTQKFINQLIEKLQKFSPNEEIMLKDYSFVDSQGNLIIEITGEWKPKD